MHSSRHLLAFVLAVNLVACAAQSHSLTTTAAAALRGREIVTTIRRAPHGSASVPGTSTFGGVGVMGVFAVRADMAEAGDRIVRENDVEDTTPAIARQLRDHLQRRYGSRGTPQSIAIADDDGPMEIAAAIPSADLVLDVRTGWSLEPVGQDSSKYGVTYVAALRLIDARMERLIDGKKGVVIADGSCRRVPEKSSSALGYQDFLANRAERLKNELEGAAHSCTDEFRAKVLTAGPAH